MNAIDKPPGQLAPQEVSLDVLREKYAKGTEADIQAQVLAKTRAKLEALELRVVELEARLGSQASAAASSSPAASSSAASGGAIPGATDPAAPHIILDKP